MHGRPVLFPYVALPAIDVQASRRLSWLQVKLGVKKPRTWRGLGRFKTRCSKSNCRKSEGHPYRDQDRRAGDGA